MNMSFRPWLMARIALGTGAILSGISSTSASMTNWAAAMVVPIILAIVIFLWLVSLAWTPKVDWSDPCSFTKPFFPLTRYPIRFWFLASVLAIFGGVVSSAHEFLLGDSISPDDGLDILSGFSILAALALFWRSSANAHNRSP